MDEERRLDMKKQIHKTGRMVLLYNLVLIVTTLIVTFLFEIMAKMEINKGTETGRAIAASIMSISELSGYLFGLAFGLIIIIAFRRKLLFSYDLRVRNKKMTLGVFLIGITVCMGMQVVYSYISQGAEILFNLFGYSIQGEIDAAEGRSEYVSMLLYVVLLGPIMEELVFRGAVLRGLEKYGKIYAIIISSLLFGIYHGNIMQCLFASALGLLFAYIALEYSIKWSILLHIFNNSMTEVINYCEKVFGEHLVDVSTDYIFGIALAAALIILFLKRKKLKLFWKENPTEKGAVRYTVTSLSLIVFFLIELSFAILGVGRL